MSSTSDNPPNLSVLLDVPIKLSVELGSCHMPMKDLLQLSVGSWVALLCFFGGGVAVALLLYRL